MEQQPPRLFLTLLRLTYDLVSQYRDFAVSLLLWVIQLYLNIIISALKVIMFKFIVSS